MKYVSYKKNMYDNKKAKSKKLPQVMNGINETV